MILCSLLIFIVAIALPSINQNIRTILYVRITSIIFIYAGALAFNGHGTTPCPRTRSLVIVIVAIEKRGTWYVTWSSSYHNYYCYQI